MKPASRTVLQTLDAQAEALKRKIRESADEITVSGKTYYVALDGSDENPGTDEAHPWKSLERVSRAPLQRGDAVRFRRGDVFRGQVICREGVTYAAYGKGEKPAIYGWERDLADATLWECADETHHIWRLTDKIPDCGTLVFDRMTQDVHSGGSGCGCSASIMCGWFFPRLQSGEYQNVLYAATGALLSPMLCQQGESIPGICHVVHLSHSAAGGE